MNALELNAAHVTTTAPTASIVTADECRRQCRIDHTTEDLDLLAWAERATEMLERDTLLLLRPMVGRLELDRAPCAGTPIYIERFPITDVTGITYVDSAGDEQTWAEEKYIVGLNTKPPRIVPAFGQAFPTLRRQPGSLQVSFEGGYAAGAAPALAKQTVLLLVGFWFRNRSLVGELGDPGNDFEKSYWAMARRLGWSP